MTPSGKYLRMFALSFLHAVLMVVSVADGKRELTEAELDKVTAGAQNADNSDELLTFEASRTTRAGTKIIADGSFRVLKAVEDSAVLGNLILTDNAQENLSSLININAVNSNVNILLNLNITIDSNVGTVNQFNLNGVLPNLPPIPLGD